MLNHQGLDDSAASQVDSERLPNYLEPHVETEKSPNASEFQGLVTRFDGKWGADVVLGKHDPIFSRRKADSPFVVVGL